MLCSLPSFCLCYLYYFCFLIFLHPRGVLYTWGHMAKWLEHIEPVLKWGHIKIRQHLRGLGTEGNLLQYDSFIMNSKNGCWEIEEISKMKALRISTALKWSRQFGTWESNLFLMQVNWHDFSPLFRRHKQLLTHKIIMNNIKEETIMWFYTDGFNSTDAGVDSFLGCAVCDLWGSFSTWR